jgi:CRISPR-associated protein Csm1
MNRGTIYLAALLHDIGKFWQRADEDGTYSSSLLSKSTKDNEGLYCPLYNGKYSHKHVLWTAEFLDKNKSFFQTILDNEHFEPFFKASVKHHKPDLDDVFQLIVQKADHYASGADRSGVWGQKDAQAENSWDAFKNVQMVSIFEGLLQKDPVFNHQIPIKTLSLSRDNFPKKDKEIAKGQAQYALLWKEFEAAFQEIVALGGDVFTVGENINFLLYRYACSVPSSTVHLPDVSLYDHLKSTAIFALCLYDYLSANDRLHHTFNIEQDEAPVLLVGGDLSGIQTYLYDIVSADAARNLKGRSFYLQILVENVVETILHRLKLPWSAVVYSSGGGFFLLAPNTPKVIEQLECIKQELSDKLFDLHKTNLSLNIDWQEVTQGQIMQQTADDGIHKAWRELTTKIGRAKAQKYKGKIQSDYAFFFEPSEIGGKQLRDFMTSEEFTEEEIKDINSKRSNAAIIEKEGNYYKKSTIDQTELGKKLRQTAYWATSFQPIPHWKSNEFSIDGFDIYNYLLSENDIRNAVNRHPDNTFIRSINLGNQESNHSTRLFKGKNCIHGFSFYGGNNSPEDENGDHITYDKMAEIGSGSSKLGVLRMDVDNLGAIFISGLEEQRRTFSRYSVLSRNLDFFFKGYLNTIWDKGYDQSTSIIYSGGDDLFIVGYWEKIFDLAQDIQKEFKNWVCQNAALGISGGIVLTGGKFPISKGADFASDAEKKAKEHEAGMVKKNALTIFEKPLNWDNELPIVLDLKNQLIQRLSEKKIPRGLLQKLMNYAQVDQKQRKDGKNLSWKWQMAYDFSRAIKDKKDTQIKDFYDEIKIAAIMDFWKKQYIKENSNYNFLELIEIAARWAELESKNNN